MDKPTTYFVHYTCVKGGIHGVGRAGIQSEKPITCIEDIDRIEKTLLEYKNVDSITISNFQRFDDEVATDG